MRVEHGNSGMAAASAVAEVRDPGAIRGSWFDALAFIGAWKRLRREPRLAIAPPGELGITAMGFARFLWVIVPTVVLSTVAAVSTWVVEPPKSSVFELARTSYDEVRAAIAADLPTAERPMAKGSADWKHFHSRTFTALFLLHEGVVDAGERRAAVSTVLQNYREDTAALDPGRRAAVAARLERLSRDAQARLRFLDRWMQSGANALSGALLTGVLLLLMSRVFHRMVNDLSPAPPRAGAAGAVFLYQVSVAVLPYFLFGLAMQVAVQIGVAYQIGWLLEVGTVAMLLVSLATLVAFVRAAGPMAEALSEGAPTPALVSALRWRAGIVFLSVQATVAVVAAAFAIGTSVWFSAVRGT